MYAKKTFNLGAWTYERDAYYNVGWLLDSNVREGSLTISLEFSLN